MMRSIRLGMAAAIVTLLLLGDSVAGAQAAKRFADVKPGAWYESSVAWALAQGIVSGYPDGTFRPGATLTEAEFLTMLLKQAGQPLRAKRPGEPWHAPVYEQAASWLQEAVRPADADKLQTRGKAAVLIAASLGRSLDEGAAVRFLLVEGIAKGRAATPGDFAPAATMTRAEAVSFMLRIADYAAKAAAARPPKEKPDIPPTDKPPVIGNAGGGSGSGNPSGENPGNGGTERPNSPPSNADNSAERTAQLTQRINALGLSIEKQGQTLSVAHPSGQGSGALLIPSSDGVGAVQILDDTEAGCLAAAHALLQYAGIAMDGSVFSNTLASVTDTGNNAALKIGSQIVTFMRTNTPGQITIHYTKM